jgi:hypothetical protein
MSGEKIDLTSRWSLQKLSVAGRPQWALCFNGMQWLKVSEFLEAGNATIDEDMREFGRDVEREKRHCDNCDCEE